MKKFLIYVFIIILIFIMSFYIGLKIDWINYEKDIEEEEIEKTDIANSEDEKISPNATVVFKTYYDKCSHTKEETETISDELVNMNKKEIVEKYAEWSIEKFSKDEIVLLKNKDEYCGEHYILKEKNGYIVVYNLDEKEEEKLYMTTSIPIEYLPQTDKHALSKGLYVYGNQELNEMLQDFE